MQIKKIILLTLMALFLLSPSFALAEEDFEQGDGWVYQDGELTIKTNQGLLHFLYHEEDMLADPNHRHNAGDVDRVIIGKNVTDIVIDYYIGDYHPSQTTVEEGNQSFIIDDGWVVNKQTNTLFGAANVKQNKTRTEIDDLPPYIEHIGMYAFSDCNKLTKITIPKGVVSIGESAFYRCSSMKSISLPSGIISIGDGVFIECTALTHIDFSDKIDYIGQAAFLSCIHLQTPPFYSMRLDTIYGNSFWGCDTFQTVEFPSTLKKIENQAFAQSKQLAVLIFQSDELTIENGALDYCENVRKLIFTKGKPADIGDSLFGETEKTPDGKSFILQYASEADRIIPYPTLYYTAAYADEWAPNGETEWNGYPIKEISQDELNAIIAEARGEPAPTPVATATPAATALPATDVSSGQLNPAETGTIKMAFLAALIAAAVAGTVAVIVARKRRKDGKTPGESK